MSVLREDEDGDAAPATTVEAQTTPTRRRQKRTRSSHAEAAAATCDVGRPRRLCNNAGPLPITMLTSKAKASPVSLQGAAGPLAALVLSEWLGNALIAAPAPASSETLVDVVRVLGVLAQAGAALPRHTSLVVALLGSSPKASVRLQAVVVLSGLPCRKIIPHLPALATQGLGDPCPKVRTATLAALAGPFSKLSKRFVPQVLARLEDTQASVRTAAAKALLQLGEAGILGAPDVKALANKLRSRLSVVRESALQALASLLASTRTNFQAKRSLETALWAQHEAVAALVVAREPCGAVRRLGLLFLSTLPRHLCERYVGTVVQGLGDARPDAQDAALAFLQGNVDPEVLRCHATALLGFFQPRAAPSSSRCELVVMQALKLVPERALEPCVGTLVAAVKKVLARAGSKEADDDKAYAGLVQGAALEVLGRMRTEVLLPLVETLSEWVFGGLGSRWTVDAVVVGQAVAALQRVRNPEIKRACLGHVVASCLERKKITPKQQETHYRARVLMFLAKRGPQVVEEHLAAVFATLQGSTTPRLRHEALKVVLVLPVAALKAHAEAMATALCAEKDAGWCTAALEVLRKVEEKKLAVLWEAVRRRVEEDKENEGQHAALLEAFKGLVKEEDETEKEEGCKADGEKSKL